MIVKEIYIYKSVSISIYLFIYYLFILLITIHQLWNNDNFLKPQTELWFISHKGGLCSQITNEVLAQVWITLGSVGPQNHFVIISPVSGFVIGIDILDHWQNFPIRSLT